MTSNYILVYDDTHNEPVLVNIDRIDVVRPRMNGGCYLIVDGELFVYATESFDTIKELLRPRSVKDLAVEQQEELEAAIKAVCPY